MGGRGESMGLDEQQGRRLSLNFLHRPTLVLIVYEKLSCSKTRMLVR